MSSVLYKKILHTNLRPSQKVAGIYKIENLINHKVYIGQSLNIYQRFRQHIRAKDNTYIHRSLRKYGVDNFSFEVIKETYDLDYWEDMFIRFYKSDISYNGYNLIPGGNTDNWGYVNNLIKEGVIRKPSEYRVFSKEARRKISEANRGRVASPELRKKLSEIQKKIIKDNPDLCWRRIQWIKDLSKEDYEQYCIKHRKASKKRHSILCVETNEYFDSERHACTVLGIGRCKFRNILKNYIAVNGYHYKIIST